jgi:hypothetical protein
MSYDFKPTYHIGYTANGSQIISRRRVKRKAPQAKRAGLFAEYNDGALRLKCLTGNSDAIAEFQYRLTHKT